MKKFLSILKSINRTLLEMWTGMIVLGIIIWLAGIIFFKAGRFYGIALWLGIFLAMLATLHMYHTLNRGLSMDEKNASKMIFRGYVIRYVIFVLIIGIIMVTKILNPLVVFLGYMTLKVTALIQPLTHKFYNKVFHEQDPVPKSLGELEEKN